MGCTDRTAPRGLICATSAFHPRSAAGQ
jgi:hypothetical protein